MTETPKNGTKYVLTAVFVAFTGAVMAASFALALKGKLSGDWVTICTICIPSVMAATVGYQVTRAYTDGKSIDAGPSPVRVDP